jgi:acid phosphatase
MIDVGSRLKEDLEDRTVWATTVRAAAAGQRGDKFQLQPGDLKVFSTDFDRTVHSVQGLLVGCFPDGPKQTIDIDCRHTTSWMIPDPQPRRTHEQEELERELANRPHILEREAEMRPLAFRSTQSLLPMLGDNAFQISYGVGEEGNPSSSSSSSLPLHERLLSWAQLSEITKCLQVRNMLPESITKDDQEALSDYCAWRWFESLRNPRLAYLSMHHFTHTIIRAMKDHRNEKPVIIYSGHDSSLIGLLCAFHLEQPSVWPEYASVLKIELLEKISRSRQEENEQEEVELADDRKEYVVRFFMNGELLRSMWQGNLREEIDLETLSHYISTVGAVKT